MRILFLLSLFSGLSTYPIVTLAASCTDTTEQAFVDEVYPTADALPENLLRFYIYFSKPMQREDILSHVYLADADGNKQSGVFLDNRLWSPDSTRLTLLFDPGRVKTGLVAHNTMGRALKPGKDYQLVVDTKARDKDGCPLGKRFTKAFKALAADYSIPDIKQWRISSPQQGSRETLVVELNGMMDHVSLASRIRVKDKDDNSVPGRIALEDAEQRWLFTPDQPWRDTGYYQLAVDSVLEDVAGNRLGGLFDQPSLAQESAAQKQRALLPVTIKLSQ